MRIAQLAPLTESVPPQRYGGTERVVSALTEELVRRGHEVTLFASADSQTSARLVPIVPRALRLAGVRDPRPLELVALATAYAQAGSFDLIHSHMDYPTLPFAAACPTPTLLTLHGRLDLPATHPAFAHFRGVPLVSISDNQRRLVPDWQWAGTVYNGIDISHFTFHPRPGDYLAFLGRISPEKGVEEAIAVAQQVGLPLKIAAKVDPLDEAYFQECVRPLLAQPLVDYVGEITEREKDAFLGQALALLMPVRWPEPFGLVMVEAMAAGTPVIARRGGSVQEVVRDGVTGFVCDSTEEMVLALRRVHELERADCRTRVEHHFSATRMADGYEAVYTRLLAPSPTPMDVVPLTAVPASATVGRQNHHVPVPAARMFGDAIGATA
jgi:glycosyltransferase involved in cell wall biosynthesis